MSTHTINNGSVFAFEIEETLDEEQVSALVDTTVNLRLVQGHLGKVERGVGEFEVVPLREIGSYVKQGYEVATLGEHALVHALYSMTKVFCGAALLTPHGRGYVHYDVCCGDMYLYFVDEEVIARYDRASVLVKKRAL